MDIVARAFSGFARQARKRLEILDAAMTLDDLSICFEWPEKSVGPVNVEIVDYH